VKVDIVIIPPDIIIHKTTKNNATAVPSLKRLSHSKSNANLLGAQMLWNIAKTATGSVADIITQKSKVTKKGISKPISGKRKKSEVPINKAEIQIPTIANNDIALQSLTIFLYFIL
jgi:hypothetical protein